jgi:2-polyprenyl-3-methyl-5-hydroxy-6-metoxy-1,4-benzoquinol methylase
MSDNYPNTAKFYDNFNTESARSPINERIIYLYSRILKLGISSDSECLEIGCGPGKLTFLLSVKIKEGSIEAFDISPKSIELARKKVSHPKVNFSVSNILEYVPRSKTFDMIFLFDVLEHIPEENHPEIFTKIASWMKDQSLLLVNIPNPNYILFARKFRPESLQEIDQAITLDKLSNAVYAAGLEINSFETYSIWAENDYQFMQIKKRVPYMETLLSSQRTIFQKAMVRIKREWWKLRYPY